MGFGLRKTRWAVLAMAAAVAASCGSGAQDTMVDVSGGKVDALGTGALALLDVSSGEIVTNLSLYRASSRLVDFTTSAGAGDATTTDLERAIGTRVEVACTPAEDCPADQRCVPCDEVATSGQFVLIPADGTAGKGDVMGCLELGASGVTAGLAVLMVVALGVETSLPLAVGGGILAVTLGVSVASFAADETVTESTKAMIEKLVREWNSCFHGSAPQ